MTPPIPNAQEYLFDRFIRSRLLFDGLDNSLIRAVGKILKLTEADIIAQVKAIDATAPRRASDRKVRLEKLLEEVKLLADSGFARVRRKMARDMLKAGQVSAESAVKDLVNALPFRWDAGMLSRDQFVAMVESKPFEGKLLKKWVADESKQTLSRMTRQFQVAMVQGEGVPEIARRVRQVMNSSRTESATIARTAIAHINAQAREAVYAKNEDLISGFVWSAALESFTCPFCRKNHGKFFKADEARPAFPVHPNCRCGWVPRLKPYGKLKEEFSGSPQVQKWYAVRTPTESWTNKDIATWLRRQEVEFDPKAKKADLLARVDGVVGQFKDKLKGYTSVDTYYQWLEKQPDFVIKDTFGATRYRLWKDGQMKLTDFDSRNGWLLSIDKIAEKLNVDPKTLR